MDYAELMTFFSKVRDTFTISGRGCVIVRLRLTLIFNFTTEIRFNYEALAGS